MAAKKKTGYIENKKIIILNKIAYQSKKVRGRNFVF
jgi:hypothetical protein